MKRLIFFLMVLYLWNVSSLFGQEAFYYTYQTKKMLNIDKNKLSIKLAPGTSPEALLSQFSFIELSSLRKHGRQLYVVSLNPGVNFLQAQRELQAHSEIVTVQKVYRTRQEGAELYLTDEICVQFLKEAPISFIDALIHRYRLHVLRKLNVEPYYLFRISKGDDALEIANRIAEEQWVLFSHPNFYTDVLRLNYTPQDQYFSRQWNFYNYGQGTRRGTSTPGADIKMTQAWNITLGSSDIQVTVIDDGMDLNHEDISSSKIVPGYDFADGDNNVQAIGENAHGTHCTGLIGADHNTIGIAGIAPNVKLQMMKIFGDDGSPASNDDVARAIDSARTQGADVISNSWGFQGVPDTNFVPAIRQAILRAINLGRNGKGCVVVFSASNTANRQNGDTGVISFPASIPQVVTVAASDRNDEVAIYSPNSNPSGNVYLDLAAPSHKAYPSQIPGEGFEVWSTDLMGSAGYNPGTTDTLAGDPQGNYSGDFGGTSAACPQVAGAAALILSLDPTLTESQVVDILTSSADKVGGYDYNAIPGKPGASLELGYGRLNVYEALQTIDMLSFLFINRIAGTEDYGHLVVDSDVNNPVPSGDTLWFELNTQHVVRTDELPFIPNWQNSGTTQKHHQFYNNNPDYSLNHQFTADVLTPFEQDANFEETKIATVKNVLLSANSSGGGNIEFRDPWRYYQDGSGNWQQSNQFISYASPFVMENDDITHYGGVFLDQPYDDPPKPYYSVRALNNQQITVNGKSITWDWESWSYNPTQIDLQSPNSRITAVVFKEDGATLTANLKGRRVSDTPAATAYNNSRNIAITADGAWHMVYEDGGYIWYTSSSDNGQSWSQDKRLSSAVPIYSAPAIVANGNNLGVAWSQSGYTVDSTTYGYRIAFRWFTPTLDWSETYYSESSYIAQNNPRPALVYSAVSTPGYYIAANIGDSPGNDKIRLFRVVDIFEELTMTEVAKEDGQASTTTGFVSLATLGGSGQPIYLAWEEQSQIYYSQYNGSSMSPKQVISGPVWYGSNQRPSLTIDSEGDVQVVWEHHPISIQGISVMHRQYSGGQWGIIRSISFKHNHLTQPTVGAFLSGLPGELALAVRGDISLPSGPTDPGIIRLFNFNGEEWLMQETTYTGTYPSITARSATPLLLYTDNTSLPYLLEETPVSPISMAPRVAGEADRSREELFDFADLPRLGLTGLTRLSFSEPEVFTGSGSLPWPFLSPDSVADSLFLETEVLPITPEMHTAHIAYQVEIDSLKGQLAAPGIPLLRISLRNLSGPGTRSMLREIPLDSLAGTTMSFRDTLEVDVSAFAGQVLAIQVETAYRLLRRKRLGNADWVDVYTYQVPEQKSFQPKTPQAVQQQSLPEKFELSANYPNPFNPSTIVEFGIPMAEWVTITIYDLAGRKVATVVDKALEAGRYQVEWNGTNDRGQAVASGVYLYRLQAGSFTQVRKMILMK